MPTSGPGAIRPIRCFTYDEGDDGRLSMNVLVLLGDIDVSPDAPGAVTVATVEAIARQCAPNRWKAPEPSSLAALVQVLNIIRQTDAPERDEPNYTRRISHALDTLATELPSLCKINWNDHVRASVEGGPTFLSAESVAVIDALLAVVQRAQRIFPARTRRRVRHEDWHDAALAIRFHAQHMWKANRAGPGKKPTSPVTKLIVALLPLVGCGDRSSKTVARRV